MPFISPVSDDLQRALGSLKAVMSDVAYVLELPDDEARLAYLRKYGPTSIKPHMKRARDFLSRYLVEE